jgi:tetratricopeptide (TPR) repeat protein
MFREVADLRASPELDARAWLGLANALRIMDRYDEALDALDRAATSLTRRERPDLLAKIWTLRGNIHFPRGELEACRDAHEKALAYAVQAGSPVEEARALGGLGDAWYQRGRMRTARDYFARCVAQARQQGSVGLALSHAPMLAIASAYCGEIRRALTDCEELVEAAARVGDLRSEILARDAQALLSLYRAHYPRAQQTAEHALELARRLGARRFEAEVMGLLGHALAGQGETAAALNLLEQAAALALEVCPSYCGPWCLASLALFTPDAGRARSLLQEGEALLAEGCVSHNYLEFYWLAMEFDLRAGDWDEARRLAEALAEYTRNEPLPWAELVIRRANWLADRGAGGSADAHELEERRLTLLRDIEAMDFAWCRVALSHDEK